MVPVYINNWNILTWVQKMCNYLEQVPNIAIVIIDNNSTYQPLLDWYKCCNYEIIRLPENRGPYNGYNFVLKGEEHVKKYGSDFFAFTDADIDLSLCPVDFMDMLQEGVKRHSKKCGLSIEINDVPENSLSYDWVTIEKQFWCNKLDEFYYDSAVDTTFALYHKSHVNYTVRATRSDRPYTCRHLPWYFTSSSEFSKEEIYMYSQNPVKVGCGGTFTKNLTEYIATQRMKHIKM